MDGFADYRMKRGDNIDPGSNGLSPGDRSWYERDVDRIVYSSAFRRLQRKSQLLPAFDPRRRTRMVHVLEVARIAISISRRLGLNETLTEAIALGHDVANAPYGSVGNSVLEELSGGRMEPGAFRHESAGALMVQTVGARMLSGDEKGAASRLIREQGAHATWIAETPGAKMQLSLARVVIDAKDQYFEYRISPEVLDGIRKHNSELNVVPASTLEGQVVMFADNFAYLCQDLDDLMRARIIQDTELTQHSAAPELTVKDRTTGDERTMSWIDIVGEFEGHASLKGVFSQRQGPRVKALIERFIAHNEKAQRSNALADMPSDFHTTNIPRLELDPGLQHVVNFVWQELIVPCYSNAHLAAASSIHRSSLAALFHLIHTTTDYDFAEKARGLVREIRTRMDGSRFDDQSAAWRTCYCIAHFTWDDVENVLRSYRDVVQDLRIGLALDGLDLERANGDELL